MKKFNNYINESLNDNSDYDFSKEKLTIVYDYDLSELFFRIIEDLDEFGDVHKITITEKYIKRMIKLTKILIKDMFEENDNCSPSVDTSQLYYDMIDKYYNDNLDDFLKEIITDKDLKTNAFKI